MVSIRKKGNRVMNEGGQRRSARLLALEQKTENSSLNMVPMDDFHPPSYTQEYVRKRNRKQVREVNEEENVQVEDQNSNGEKTTDRTIEHILDMLELKDTKELFSMPDEFQTTDYLERVRKPGDFATLRQKHKDGMYQTLEQFENDVYMVFQKAMDSNSRDSVPFKEAMGLLDHAKKVFQSLKNNRMYAELELAAWHKKNFPKKRRVLRSEVNGKGLSSDTRTGSTSDTAFHANMKLSDASVNHSANARSKYCDNQGYKPSSAFLSSRRASSADFAESSKASEEQRRDTYKMKSDSNKPASAIAYRQPLLLVHNNSAPSYRESLLKYVKNSGPDAKTAAEMKSPQQPDHVKERPFTTYLRKNTKAGSHKFNSESSLRNASMLAPFQNISSSSGNNVGPHLTGASKMTYLQNNTFVHKTDSHLNNAARVASFQNNNHFSPGASSSKGIAQANFSNSGYQADDEELLNGPQCKLETDELLKLFSAIGTPEFLERSKSILTSSSTGKTAWIGERSMNLNLPVNSGGQHEQSAIKPGFNGFLPMIQQGQCSRMEPPKRISSLYDLPFVQLEMGRPKQSAQKGVAIHGTSDAAPKALPTPNLGFSQFATSSQSFKPSNLNAFFRQK